MCFNEVDNERLVNFGHRSYYSKSMSSPQKRMLARKGSSDHPEVGFEGGESGCFSATHFLGSNDLDHGNINETAVVAVIPIRCF